jgi:hypothetical protein
MGNPFTLESRDAVLSLNIEGLLPRLRAPESLRRLLVDVKPQHMPMGDFALKSMVDAHLMALIIAGRYREVQATLVAMFGVPDHKADGETTNVVSDNGSSKKPPAKAAAR